MIVPEILADHFDLLADAPDGIRTLRKLVLGLAVRGRLVLQDQSDEPVSVLLEQLNTKRSQLIDDGKCRPLKALPSVGQADVEFPIPANWEWRRFGEATINRDGERIPLSRAVREGRKGPYDYYGASGVIDSIDDYIFKEPLLLIGEDGANLINRSTPIAFIAQGEYWVNNHAHVLDGASLEYLRYLALFINATDLKPYVTGTAQPKMNQAKMNTIPVALPPESEQRRILAKVDELMALCDELDQRQQKRNETRVQVCTASHAALTSATTPKQFARHWTRIRNHFDLLYDTPQNVQELRQLILQLAVQGKLVEQNAEDERVQGLCRKLREQRRKHWEELELAKMRAKNSLPRDEGWKKRFKDSTQGDFSCLPRLPKNWCWVKVEQAGEVQLGRQRAPRYHTGPNMRPYLRVQNVYENRIDLSDVKEMDFSPADYAVFALKDGDILLNEGQSAKLVGRPAIYRDELPGACFQNTLVRFRYYPPLVPGYALIVFRSYMHSGRFQEISQQTTNIAHLGAGRFAQLEFPLPPEQEQHRIVAKIDQLMASCDDLETKLTQSQADNEKLMEAVVHRLLTARA